MSKQSIENNAVLKSMGNYVMDKINIDKVKFGLFVTWMWAYAGLLITKSFEGMFRLILSMPDSWYSAPSKLIKLPTTTQKKKIHIISASDGTGSITNKLKLFLKYSWDNASVYDVNGFSMKTFKRLFSTSLLYGSYLLTETDTITPEDFIDNVHKFFVMQKPNGKFAMSKNSDLTDLEELIGSHLSFDDEPLVSYDDNMDLNMEDFDLSE